jgi:hypothetical protein
MKSGQILSTYEDTMIVEGRQSEDGEAIEEAVSAIQGKRSVNRLNLNGHGGV